MSKDLCSVRVFEVGGLIFKVKKNFILWTLFAIYFFRSTYMYTWVDLYASLFGTFLLLLETSFKAAVLKQLRGRQLLKLGISWLSDPNLTFLSSILLKRKMQDVLWVIRF